MPLRVTVPKFEIYNEETNEFQTFNEVTISLEHSLVSVSKWESKWHKPFLYGDKTGEELVDYIRCMTISQNINYDIYNYLPNSVIRQITDYIDDSMTATTIKEDPFNRRSNQIVTSEIIYYWMIAFNIPIECQKWHLNRLLTLIKVCEEKNKPSKKMSKSEINNQYRSINAARRAAAKSRMR